MNTNNEQRINGFSKLTKAERRLWLLENILGTDRATDLRRFDADSPELQAVLDNFSENTVANFPLPFGVAPNFVV
ncbi:MAG: hydroxymethylglutaryl-CoA reductase, partial [Bacteroidota bacterium]